MKLFGQYVLYPDTPQEQFVPNTIVEDGSTDFLKLIFQAINGLPATFYLGLTNAAYDFTTATLATIAAGEPVGNGYARQALNRDGVDFDVSLVNGLVRARSKIVTFLATGDWDKTYNKQFLCNAAAGTVGKVFSLSGPTEVPITVLAGANQPVRYELWNRV